MNDRPRIPGQHPAYAILGPCPCQRCGTLVYWARGVTRLHGQVVKGTAWWREPTGRRHRCSLGIRPKVAA